MFSTVEELLFAQAVVTGIILLVFGVSLARRGLFHWTSTGFWAWASFALYFLVNPLASIWWNTAQYRVRLLISGGLSRGEWIMLVAAAGMIVFFVAYLYTSTRSVTWNLPLESFQYTLPVKVVMAIFVGMAGLSLLTYRTGAIFSTRNFVIENGRFVGETTGYEAVGHIFIFFPVVLLLLSQSHTQRLLGWLIGSSYVVLSMPDAWGRFTLVSMLLAMSLAHTLRQRRTWPRPIFIGVIVLTAAVLQLRGHSSLDSTADFYNLATQAPEEIGFVLAAGDTAMLATWYVRSYVSDHITGYDYAIPLFNYVFLGAIPSRFFPQKYFLIDWLQSQRSPVHDSSVSNLLYGAKSSLLGSFYGDGGFFAVILGAWLAGVLSRKMDGMLATESSIVVRATGLSWLSMLWMIWGSSETWAVIHIGTVLIPALAIWLVSPKVTSSPWQTSRLASIDNLPHRHQSDVSSRALSIGVKYSIRRR